MNSLTLTFTPDAIAKINSYVAEHAPERGGALMGLVGEQVITDFIPDPDGQMSGVSYLPSHALFNCIQMLERQNSRLEFKGVLHSHPGGMSHLSSPDLDAIAHGLSENPHMDCFMAPIVSRTYGNSRLGDHEIALNESTKLTCYALRLNGRKLAIREIPVKVSSNSAVVTNTNKKMVTIPSVISKDLENVVSKFKAIAPAEFGRSEIEDTRAVVATLRFAEGVELMLYFPDSYPSFAPVALLTVGDDDTIQPNLTWQLTTPADRRLVSALAEFLDVSNGGGSYRQVYGVLGKSPLTSDPHRAALAGWHGSLSASDLEANTQSFQAGLAARTEPLLGQHIRAKRVLLIGAGSAGSYMAEQLIRSGVGAITLVDEDIVETANLSRTIYDVHDVGSSKVNALAKRLLQINPSVDVLPVHYSMFDFETVEFDALVNAADLVIAATDDAKAQMSINRFAYARQKPAIYVGLYEGAKGGEIILSLPDRTPCYLCATYSRHEAEDLGEVSRSTDYGTGRLKAVVALAADIQHVCSAGVKMALSLLLPEDAEGDFKNFLSPIVANGQSFITFSMEPNFWFYPRIFNNAPGQFAYQSVCLTPKRRAECPVCGEVHHRADPLQIPLKQIDANALRELLS